MSKKAEEIIRQFFELKHNEHYQNWRKEAFECLEYRMGAQIPREIVDELKLRGQADLVVNKIHPAVEISKALMTYNHPRFQIFPREDSDVEVATVLNNLIEYIWNISDGNIQLKQAIDDYLIKGKGYLILYFDPLEDNGKGEIKIKYIDALEVFPDMHCTDKYERDAAFYFISKVVSRERAKMMYPEHKRAIDNAKGCVDELPYEGLSGDTSLDKENMAITKADTQSRTQDLVRILEKYEPISVKFYRIVDYVRGGEYLLNENEFIEFLNTSVYILELPNGEIFYSDKLQEINDALFAILQNVEDEGAIKEYIKNNPIKTGKIEDLVDGGYIEYVDIVKRRIKRTILVGDKIIGEEIMPISDYPIIPFPNIWNGTPLPLSDVKVAMGLQDFINKLMSLIIAHTQASTNIKLLLPKGSIQNREMIEREWAKPLAIIEYDPQFGKPEFASPTPLSNEVFALLAQVTN